MADRTSAGAVLGVSPAPGATGAGVGESLSVPRLRPLIHGRRKGGTGTILVDLNPATGETIAHVIGAGPEDFEAAVESAASAASLWRRAPFEERASKMNALADLILDHAETLATLIETEQGKPAHEALTLEILPALDHLRFLARHAEAFFRGEGIEPRHPLFSHKHAHYLFDPLGVVAIVTPYTLPFAIPVVQVGAAVAMGNAAILKPSEHTPLIGLRVGELFLEAGFPAGLVNVVPSTGDEALHLAAHPQVDKVFLTGTLAAGQHIMATAGCAPRPVVLALNGKHPSIVAADADIARAARGILWGACANAGQNCGAVERVYVEDACASKFINALIEEAGKLQGIGPLISAGRREEVHLQVGEAVEDGARVLCGGRIPEGRGYFYPPTVLLGPPPGSRILREETLGPVIPVVVVENLERALLMANESDYALTASGWTASEETANRMMVGLQAGVVTINDVLYSFGEPAATWAGFRKSGIGYNHGIAGLREMCRQRFVSFDPKPAEAPLFSYPYDARAGEVVRNAMNMLHKPRRLQRFAAFTRMIFNTRFRARVPLRKFFVGYRQRKRED